MNRRQLSFAVASVISLCFILLSIHTWSALGGGFVDFPNMITQMTTPREPTLHLQHFPKKIWDAWVADSQVHSIIRSVEARETMDEFLRSTMENDV